MTLNFQPMPNTRLTGRWLGVVWLAFMVVAVLLFGVGLMSNVAYARVVSPVCATTEEC